MRIAYISYEYPPDTAVGGIATYVFQVAVLMKQRGHDIEIFTASPMRTISEEAVGIKIHRVRCLDRSIFNEAILPYFEKIHDVNPFEIIESPEFSGDGLAIKVKYPNLPLVVKLHTPWYLIDLLAFTYLSIYSKTRFIISGLIRGKLYKAFWKIRKKETDLDYLITKKADQIHTPSISLGDIIADKWQIKRSSIINIPNPYQPNKELLTIPIDSSSNRVTYIGRLEIRKGLVELGKAIKIVLKQQPNVKFRFVGKIQDSHKPGIDMKTYLCTLLRKYIHQLEFLEVTSEEIYQIYKETDICVFPSIWENFPNTCLEAMSAGRGIVASKNGGMLDMLKDCSAGILIDPFKSKEIAEAINELLLNKDLRMRMGENARNKVLTSYNNETIGSAIEKNYLKIINKY